MLLNSQKINLFLSAWKKYIPVVRILIKRSAEEVQLLSMDSADFERDGKKKYGNKFVIHFNNGKADLIIASTEIIQSFISALLSDTVTSSLLLKHNYTFTLNNKYQLQITNHSMPLAEVATEPAALELA